MTWPSFKLQIEQQIDAIASTIQFRCCEYIHIYAHVWRFVSRTRGEEATMVLD